MLDRNLYFENFKHFTFGSVIFETLKQMSKQATPNRNPFSAPLFRAQRCAFSLDTVLQQVGVSSASRHGSHNKCNFNPFVIGEDGNKCYYQRPFCWTKRDKQLLIESIYEGVSIGQFVFRKRSYKFHLAPEYTIDVVDGKQRLSALIGFYQNEFKDLHGNYYRDLDETAKRLFDCFQNLAYLVLSEGATDAETLAAFKAVNFTGKQMSKSHLDFVKSIRLQNGK